MSGLLGASWVRFYFALAGLLVLGFVFASQALARGAGAGAPLLTTTPTNTFTPTSTFTPVTGVTATPSCCDDLSATGVVTCSVEDRNYHYTYTVDNDCTDTRYGTFFVYLQNAPSVDGPWDLWTTSMFPVTLPPGRTQYSGNMYVD